MEKTDSNRSVFAASINGVLQVAEHLEIAIEPLLREVGIEKRLLMDPAARFPVTSLLLLYELVADHSQTPEIGLYTGRILHINGLNLQIYMTTICKTFREYLNLMPSMLRFRGDIGELSIHRESTYIRLEWAPLRLETSKQRFLSDEYLTASAAIVNSLCIRPIPIIKAHFTYSKPDDLAVLKTTFGDELYFDQPVSCIYFARECLDYTLPQLSGDIATAMAQPLDHLFAVGAPRDEFLKKLRETVLHLLPRGEVTIDRVAQELNLSRRTLQRRLSDRDTQFAQILQRLRTDLALRYLADKRLSITEITFLLGYSDPASFTSAFKTWQGVSPRDYRLQ